MLDKKIVISLLVLILLGSAGAVLSINKINYDSDAEFGSTGQVFQITTTVDSGTDKVNLYDFNGLYASQDDLSQATDNQNVNSNIEINTENLNTWADYPVFDYSGEDPYTIELRVIELGELDSEHYDRSWTGAVTPTDQGEEYIHQQGVQKGCIDFNNDGFFEGIGQLKPGDSFLGVEAEAYCAVKQEQLADSIGRMQSPEEKFEFDLVADNGQGQVCRETFSNNEVGTGMTAVMCNGMIQAQFQGSADLGTNAPWTDNELVMHSNNWEDTSGLKITNRQDYEDWRSYMNNQLDDDIRRYYWEGGDGYVPDEEGRLTAQSSANSRVREAVSWTDEGIWGNRNRLEFRDGSMEDGSIALESWEGSRELMFPIMTILVEAGPDSFAVLEQSYGEPKINDISEVKLGETDSTSFDVKVENIGEAEGEFEVRSLGCTTGSVNTAAKTINLDSGETGTVEFIVSDISTSNEQEIEGSCEFAATDTVSQQTSSMSGQFTLVQDQHCSPNTEFRSYQDGEWVIKECGSSGLESTIVERCGEDAVAQTVDDELQCVSQGEPVTPPGPDCKWYDIPCKIVNMTVGTFIQGIVGILGMVTGFLVGSYLVLALIGKLPIQFILAGGLALALIMAGITIINPYITIIFILLSFIYFRVKINEIRKIL